MYKGSISLYNVHACLELNSASEVSYKNTSGLNLLAACSFENVDLEIQLATFWLIHVTAR